MERYFIVVFNIHWKMLMSPSYVSRNLWNCHQTNNLKLWWTEQLRIYCAAGNGFTLLEISSCLFHLQFLQVQARDKRGEVSSILRLYSETLTYCQC